MRNLHGWQRFAGCLLRRSLNVRARYLGDHDKFSAWGIRFPRGIFVPVSDAHAQKKIAGNRHFEIENSDAEEVEFVETVKTECQEVAEPAQAEFMAPEEFAPEVTEEAAEEPQPAQPTDDKPPFASIQKHHNKRRK